MNLATLAATATLLLATSTLALAQFPSNGSPCCAMKPCTSRDLQGKCLTPNGEKTCVPNDTGNVTTIPARGAVAGCVDGSAVDCIGGATTPAGPEGCVGMQGSYYTGVGIPVSATECTNASVDACCEYGACY